ncbi:MAG: hypothetical protein ACOC0O_04780 [Spirochaetota bacterium]
MRNYVKTVVLDNEIEARLLSSLLDEEGIPHYLRTYRDSAYDGLFQTERGWGHIEADPRHHDRIGELLEDIRSQRGGHANG